MINIKIKDREAEISTEGMLITIVVELVTAIKLLYNDIASDNKGAADTFRDAMKVIIASPDSPIWREDKKEDAIKFLFEGGDLWRMK